MTAEELKAMSSEELRGLAEEIRREMKRRYEREWRSKNPDKAKAQAQRFRERHPDAWKKYMASESPSARKGLKNWIDRTLADVEKAEEIAKYENSL